MTRFSLGDRVRIVGGGVGVVVEVHPEYEPPSYRVFVTALSTPMVSEPDLEDPGTEEPDMVALLRNGAYAPTSRFLYALTQRKIANHLTDTLYSYDAARIQIEPHQFKPLLKLLDSPYRRLLIADEVGLGKTIEAGIILNEFDLRERLERVLVVCPHALLYKWRDELEAKFGMRFEVWSASQMRRWLEEALRTGIAAPGRWIASLEALRSPELGELMEEATVSIDLLIVDEAHHLRNDDTYSFELGQRLSKLSDIVLFLTATPLNLRNRDLFNLVHLLLPDVYSDEDTFLAQIAPNQALNSAIRQLRGGAPNQEVRAQLGILTTGANSALFSRSTRFNEVLERLDSTEALTRDERVAFQRICTDLNALDGVMTRTRKADVAPFAVREPYAIELQFSGSERAFYDAVTAFCVERYSTTGGSGFGAITYQRMLCSSIPAMRSVLNQIADGTQQDLDESDVFVDAEEKRAYSSSEEQLLQEARLAGEAVGVDDSKLRALEELLQKLVTQEGVKRILIFSFFRRTVQYLRFRLESKYRVGCIVGGMQLEERADEVDRFRDGEVEILLSSEVGGEGLDFQFCNVLVNYDLPWNPMRVEQRIGRLDRYGQQHEKILIYNLFVSDTVETRIFGRLFERIELFKAAIGDLEAILGESVRELTAAAMDLRLTPEQQAAKAEQLAQQLIHRRKHEEELVKGKDALLSNEQFYLDQFSDIEHGRSYLTPEELETFFAEGLKLWFDGSRLTRSGSRTWLRPDSRFLGYVRSEVYKPGADGRFHQGTHAMRPLGRLMHAVAEGQAIPVTFSGKEGFADRQLETLTVQHPYTQALVNRASVESLTRYSVARLVLDPTNELQTGTHLVATYKLESTGLRSHRRLETVTVSLTERRPARMPPPWIGRFVQQARQDATQAPPSDRQGITECAQLADQLISDVVNSEREAMQSRQADLVLMRTTSLDHSFQRRRARLEAAIHEVGNVRIQRMRRAQLDALEEQHRASIEQLLGQSNVALTWERIALALIDVP